MNTLKRLSDLYDSITENGKWKAKRALFANNAKALDLLAKSFEQVVWIQVRVAPSGLTDHQAIAQLRLEIATIFEERGFNQTQLAKRLGKSRPWVSQWLSTSLTAERGNVGHLSRSFFLTGHILSVKYLPAGTEIDEEGVVCPTGILSLVSSLEEELMSLRPDAASDYNRGFALNSIVKIHGKACSPLAKRLYENALNHFEKRQYEQAWTIATILSLILSE